MTIEIKRVSTPEELLTSWSVRARARPSADLCGDSWPSSVSSFQPPAIETIKRIPKNVNSSPVILAEKAALQYHPRFPEASECSRSSWQLWLQYRRWAAQPEGATPLEWVLQWRWVCSSSSYSQHPFPAEALGLGPTPVPDAAAQMRWEIAVWASPSLPACGRAAALHCGCSWRWCPGAAWFEKDGE